MLRGFLSRQFTGVTTSGRHQIAFANTFFAARHQASSSATATVTSEEEPAAYQCLLCDEEYADWGHHSRSRYHRARHAVCSALVNPEKHAAIMQQMWEHIRIDFNLVDEISDKKIERRRSRLTSTLAYLRDSDVVRHAFFQRRPQQEVEGGKEQSELEKATSHEEDKDGVAASKQFLRFLAIGEPQLRFEVTDRVARLFPKASLTDLSVISQTILHLDNIEALYDFLHLDELLMPGTIQEAPLEGGEDILDSAEGGETGPSAVTPWEPDTAEKGAIVFALCGELFDFTSQDRPHSVGTRERADALVNNVLGTHAMENMVSELVHFVLQRIVDEGTPVWMEYKAELPKLVMQSTRAKRSSLDLAPAPSKPPADAKETEQRMASEVNASDLGKLASTRPEESAKVDAPVVIKPTMHDLVRSCAMTVTVPTPVSKTAFFTPMMPKLALKARAAPATRAQKK